MTGSGDHPGTPDGADTDEPAAVRPRYRALLSVCATLLEVISRNWDTWAESASEADVEDLVRVFVSARRLFPTTPGVCISCGCTEERACEEGCGWIDGMRTLCSACWPFRIAADS